MRRNTVRSAVRGRSKTCSDEDARDDHNSRTLDPRHTSAIDDTRYQHYSCGRVGLRTMDNALTRIWGDERVKRILAPDREVVQLWTGGHAGRGRTKPPKFCTHDRLIHSKEKENDEQDATDGSEYDV